MQPVDPVEQWTSPPFEATVRDGEIYARGAADDKGQVFMHMKAVEAFLKKAGSLPVNIQFFLEGEEEVGSRHLDDFVVEGQPRQRSEHQGMRVASSSAARRTSCEPGAHASIR